jgi:hypothetical protein
MLSSSEKSQNDLTFEVIVLRVVNLSLASSVFPQPMKMQCGKAGIKQIAQVYIHGFTAQPCSTVVGLE